MPLGYTGYLQLGSTGEYLLTNSAGINRVVNPLQSTGVWGAGWYNAATTTNYADSQQHFEGSVAFDLQGTPTVWNLIRDWVIEERATSQTVKLSPNGLVVHDYTYSATDLRSGVWAGSAALNIDSGSIITMTVNCTALQRTETCTTGTLNTALRSGVGTPTSPLNPTPRNQNPIPGWNAGVDITWPNSAAAWSPTVLDGMVLQNASVNINNNLQVIRGCTGDINPVAVLVGTMTVDGSITMWRDGCIEDPYKDPCVFTAEDSNIDFSIGAGSCSSGGTILGMSVPNVLLTSDAYDIQGANSPVTRVFGFSGLGDGVSPPFTMDVAT